jgi:CRISPR type IV-associated protein Csf1
MLTATQLIRQAALKTGSIEVKPGKVIVYADPPLESVQDTACWLCGGKTGGHGVPTRKAIKDTFTDHPWARGQGSKSLCPGCAFCLASRELRNYSILATPVGLRHPSRAEWREILLNPPEPPFVVCLAVSGQKHLTFKAPVNLSREVFVVALEEQMVEVVPSRLADCLQAAEALYAWFTKEEIATGRYSQHRIQQCGLSRWERLDAALEPWRGNRMLELALFIAQKPEQPEPENVAPQREEVDWHAPPPAAAVAGGETTDPGPVQIGFDWV